jgi:hypothetical protein
MLHGDYEIIRSKYPTKIPVIIIGNDFAVKKRKFLVEEKECFSILFFEIRRHIETSARDSVLFLVENQIVTPSTNIGEFHSKICLQKEDKFLYILLTRQQTFG